jgi:Zn finger protein HypA/HybF involved in hydrogenase expression
MSVLDADTKSTSCPGSYVKVGRKGSKYIRGTLKYRCPICEKHVGRDDGGRLNKHGYKLNVVSESSICYCGKCSKKFEGLDYLCPKCRAKEEKT